MLTQGDYDVLIEAVGAWEAQDATNGLMGDIFGAILCKDDAQREKVMAERDAKREQAKAKHRVKEERAIILKSKLIQMRDSQAADMVLETARR